MKPACWGAGEAGLIGVLGQASSPAVRRSPGQVRKKGMWTHPSRQGPRPRSRSSLRCSMDGCLFSHFHDNRGTVAW